MSASRLLHDELPPTRPVLVERPAAPDDTQVSSLIAHRSSRALADAIGLMEEAERLLQEWESLDAATKVMLGGTEGAADPDGEHASRCAERTGQHHLLSVLIAVGDRLRDRTGCEGSYLRDESAYQLRRRFATLLVDPWLTAEIVQPPEPRAPRSR